MQLVTSISFVPSTPHACSVVPEAVGAPPQRDTLSVAEVAQRLGVDQKTVRRAIVQREIYAVRVGGRLLVPRPWLERWLRGETAHPDFGADLPARESVSRKRRHDA